MPLQNFGLVNKNPVAAIARCAQPDVKGCTDLKAMGFDYIIKLNETSESSNTAEINIFGDGFIYNPYPPIYNIPSTDEVNHTVDMIWELFLNNKSVVVHCTHGRDRTGLVIGLFRIKYDGWTFDQVEQERQIYGATGLIDNIADSKIIAFLKDQAAYNDSHNK